MTADVLNFKDYYSVRFFYDEVICGYCGKDTRGRVMDRSEKVVCTHCGGAMLELNSSDFQNVATIIFSPEGD